MQQSSDHPLHRMSGIHLAREPGMDSGSASSHQLPEPMFQPEAYAHSADDLQLHETHISWVVLSGPYGYKVKKPVNLGFLDFSSVERRAADCADEVRLNRRLCPDVYLGVCWLVAGVAADRLASLGATSMLVESSVSGSATRFGGRITLPRGPRHAMLETIREFGLERLESSGEADMTRHRQVEFGTTPTSAMSFGAGDSVNPRRQQLPFSARTCATRRRGAPAAPRRRWHQAAHRPTDTACRRGGA
jgi:hypothetical protein